MTTDEAIAHFGGRTKLAEALGITRNAVYLWGDTPPIDRQCHIEIISGGALRADVERPTEASGTEEGQTGRSGATA